MKRTPLTRSTPLRKRRPTPRNRKSVVRLTGQELRSLRLQCWVRDNCRCRDCGRLTRWQARFDGDPLAFDMAHIKSRGAGGSDTLDNLLTKCHSCHVTEHTKGKQGGQNATSL